MTLLTTATFADIITFTRSSPGTYWGEDGLLATAATNEPRLEWSPVSALAGLSVQRRTVTLTRGQWSLSMAGTGSVAVRIAGRLVATATSATRRRIYVRADDTAVELTPLGSVTAWDLRAGLGFLVEGQSRVNIALHNRDLTNAAWVDTDITAAKDQTGIDGAANAASSITATAGNATILQSITSASAARFTTAYVRRLVGSGVVEMTQNGGSTWTPVTVTDEWARVSIPSATLANPEVGFRIVTSGDSIAVDYVQVENSAFATSAIATEGVSVTRGADIPVIEGAVFSKFYNQQQGTIYIESAVVTNAMAITCISDGTLNNRMQISTSGIAAFQYAVVNSGVVVAQIGIGTNVFPNFYSISGALQNDNCIICVDGELSAEDTDVSLPVFNILHFGRLSGGELPATYYIRRLDYCPRRRVNAELQKITG